MSARYPVEMQSWTEHLVALDGLHLPPLSRNIPRTGTASRLVDRQLAHVPGAEKSASRSRASVMRILGETGFQLVERARPALFVATAGLLGV